MVSARSLNPLHALLLGIVEGLTEYLPVSSTGHLLLVSHWLGIPKDQADSFSIVIQAGAILAVVVHYRALLATHLRGVLGREARSLRLLFALVIACVPTIGTALVFRKAIKAKLFGNTPVAIGLLVGGIVMIVVDRWRARGAAAPPADTEPVRTGATSHAEMDVEKVTLRQAGVVGLTQIAALWPGTSRSLSAIVGGQLAGLSTRAAADFAFLLGLPVLGGACLYEGYKERAVLAECGALSLGIGLLVSFLVAWGVIAVFLRYLRRGSLVPFGLYRIVLAIGVLASGYLAG